MFCCVLLQSKAGADAALKASPITANGIVCHLCNTELVPARQSTKKSKVKNTKEEVDDEEDEDGENDDEEEVESDDNDEEEVEGEDDDEEGVEEEEEVDGDSDEEDVDGEEDDEEMDEEDDEDEEEAESDGSMDVSVSKKPTNGVKVSKQFFFVILM